MSGGSGPAVVLVHGWPFTWVEWRAVMPLLAERGYTVIAPDLRGSGDSSVPAGRWTKRDEAEDLHQLLGHLGHERAFVAGTDVGTMTVHAWAQAHPDDISRLVLSEAFLPGYGLEDHMNPAAGGSWHFGFHAQSELAALLTEGKEEQYLSGFWSMMTKGGITESDRAELLRAYTRPHAMRGGFEHYATLVDDGRTARAGGVLEMPVLVLNGEHGLPQHVLLEGARQAAREVSADIILGAAHTFAADNPHATAERLARFFTTNPGI
ncbi:alpha/beta hydrolase [Streptomyces yokosukanensis]|uniref:alpha/beta fold hydrolase n=1 Tax=Streptomyces yokosukanensis TaxID=67386 RepID=UPI00131A8626|nr:alpha/beta hydrolase [Streptomyces yokosukanensis]